QRGIIRKPLRRRPANSRIRQPDKSSACIYSPRISAADSPGLQRLAERFASHGTVSRTNGRALAASVEHETKDSLLIDFPIMHTTSTNVPPRRNRTLVSVFGVAPRRIGGTE